MKNFISFIAVLLCMLSFSACQKAVVDDFNEPSTNQEGANTVTFNIKQFEQIPFDKAKASRSKNIKDLCSNVNLAIFFGSKRIKDDKQKSSDSDFGTFSLKLDEGTYLALIVAHNQSKSPSTTNPEKIQFENDLSDVFFWSKEITINDGEEQSIDVDMHRQAAMVRFVTTDNVPDDIVSVKFYYQGGSAALNATTGLGSVNSKQTAIRTVTSEMKGKPATFEIYSIPKEEEGSFLDIQVTGLDKEGNSVFDRTFKQVPIKRNMITVNKGQLFVNNLSKGSEGSVTFTLTTNEEWGESEIEY